jgi:membrane fusion protein, multidrug efflux system
MIMPQPQFKQGLNPLKKLSKTILLLLLVIVLVSVWFLWPSAPAKNTTVSSRGSNPPIPVRVVKVENVSLDILLSALGTVTPYNSVTVRSRVQGQLVEVLFIEGEFVEKGQLLARIDPRAYEAALSKTLGQQQQNVALLDSARRTLERYQTLRKQDSIPVQQVDTQVALVRQLEGQVKSDQATVDDAKLQLDFTQIRAPISGRLGLRKVDVGNLLTANDVQGLVVITQTQPISVIFTLPEGDLTQVREPLQNNQVLPVEVFDRQDTRLLAAGDLTTLDNQIDLTTGTFKLKARFTNQDDSLFPNQFVNVRLRVQKRDNVLTVLAGAIQQNSQGAFVFLVQPDKKVTIRPVKTGARNQDVVEILSGLKVGDQVVLEGTDRLREGSAVKVANAQLN